MPRKIIAVLLSVLVIVTAFALPTFAAEDDLIQYATNLIPFPYVKTGTTYKNGVTFTVQEDGGIHVSGTATSNITFEICKALTLKTGVYYTISGGFYGDDNSDPVIVNARKYTSSGSDVGWIESGSSNPVTGILNEGESIIYIAIYVGNGRSVDATVYPMLNIGDFAAPYMLYLPYVLEQQYNNGYVNGEAVGSTSGYDKGYAEGESAGLIQGAEDGFKDGYQAGLDASATSINPFSIPFTILVVPDTRYVLNDVTYYYEDPFDLAASFVNYNDYSFNVSLMVTNARNYVYNKIISKTPSATSITHQTYSFKLVWERSAENRGSFYFDDHSVFSFSSIVSGLPDSMTLAGFLGDEWDGFTVFSTADYHYSLPTDVDLSSFSCQTVAFNVSSKFTENSVYLYADSSVLSPSYMSGYNQGYFDGAKDGLAEQADLFFDQGYNKGFKEGKEEGLTIADSGDWRHLMLAVTEAPINTFQSLFNFEILGMDMRAAFGSILAVCVVLLIVKKVIF